MFIQVTRADINHGKRFHCTARPIARAIVRQVTGIDAVAVEYDSEISLWLKMELQMKCYAEQTQKVRRFIKRFDNGQKVKPFGFDLVNYED